VIEHTYLFEEARWRVRGQFFGEDGSTIDITGESRVTHEPLVWRIDGLTRLALPSLEFREPYEVDPPATPGSPIWWRSPNSRLGLLLGCFVVVDDTILSRFESASGNHRGVESLRRLERGLYEARGALLEGERRVSSWSVELVRAD
jgi:hypothetical protein